MVAAEHGLPRPPQCRRWLPSPWSDWVVLLEARAGCLERVWLLPAGGGEGRRYPEGSDPVLERAAAALQGYFRDPRRCPRAPLAERGTPFQRRVWAALRRIPAGRTRTYGELARELGSSPRAVAAACRANPFPLFVPCHRAVGASGLGGFLGQGTGAGPALKARLLGREGVAPWG